MEYEVVSFEQEAPNDLSFSNRRIYKSPAMHITLSSYLGVEIKITLNDNLREDHKREMANVFYKAYTDRTPIKIAFGLIGEELNKPIESPKI